MRKNDQNNLRKSLEGARKYVGSDVREGTFPGSSCGTSLIKVGRFWWFLRNSQQHTTVFASPLLSRRWNACMQANNSFLWRHSRLRNNLRACSDFSFVSPFMHFFLKNEFEIRFSPVVSHHMMKSACWSGPWHQPRCDGSLPAQPIRNHNTRNS